MSPSVVVLICLSLSTFVFGLYVDQCMLPLRLRNEIHSYQGAVNRIVNHVVDGKASEKAYNALKVFAYRFKPRIPGSSVLEKAIDFLEEKAEDEGLVVRSQKVQVPHWTSGREEAKMLTPRITNIPVLGLGGSVSTHSNGIVARVLVVRTFSELHDKREQARGKIVVVIPRFKSYGMMAIYQRRGAVEAAHYGAVAVLVQSNLASVVRANRTGSVQYDWMTRKIPAASISRTDGEMLYRLSKRHIPIKMRLHLHSSATVSKTSRNLMVDYPGWDESRKYVFISGHMDSWSSGEGSVDDGSGAFLALYTPIILQELKLQARRTTRAVLLTSQKWGRHGATAYKKHANHNNIILALDSNGAVFNPTGLEMGGSHTARCIIHEILQMLAPINATILESDPSPGDDVKKWNETPVPVAALRNGVGHHSTDIVDFKDPRDMDRSLALFAAVSYVVADLKYPLPRDE